MWVTISANESVRRLLGLKKEIWSVRQWNALENTISLDNSIGESVGLRLAGSPYFSFMKKILTFRYQKLYKPDVRRINDMMFVNASKGVVAKDFCRIHNV